MAEAFNGFDYDRPEETGPAVLEKLRANNATKRIPVILGLPFSNAILAPYRSHCSQ